MFINLKESIKHCARLIIRVGRIKKEQDTLVLTFKEISILRKKVNRKDNPENHE